MRQPFWLKRDEVRAVDERAIRDYHMPGLLLMENAGRNAAELLLRLNTKEQPVHILCGPGNNGGDGFVIARHMQNAGIAVDVWLFAEMADGAPRLAADAHVNYTIWRAGGGSLTCFDLRTPDCFTMVHRQRILTQRGWLVDALFGTGLTRAIVPPITDLLHAMNTSGRPVFAVDIPSGLDADTGKPLGPTVRAQHTATFVALKKGFLPPEAWPWLGKVHVLGIGAPQRLLDELRQLPAE